MEFAKMMGSEILKSKFLIDRPQANRRFLGQAEKILIE